MHPGGIANIALLLGRLAAPAQRVATSSELARVLGADALLILVRDPELMVLLPAPGFPQTLRGGPTWRRFLNSLGEPGRHDAVVDYPSPEDETAVVAHVFPDGIAVALFGGRVAPDAFDAVVPMFPLVSALIRSEVIEQRAATEASIARLEGRRAVELATALDGARTDLERALVESAQLNAALHETDRRKNEFLAMLGHELRNPLSAISAAVEIMRVSGHDPAQVDRARLITERQTQHLTRLVEDLLDVARVTRGKVSLRLERVEVHEIVRRAIEAVAPELAAHTFELVVGDPVSAMADPARLEQMVSNLLTNAAKYTDPGGRIHLVLERDAAAGEPGEAVIRVRDSGIGIATEMLPRIFDPFVQIAPPLHRSGAGLGMGLTLVSHLVHLHGGRISVTSELGQGSEFVLRIPALPAAPTIARSVPVPAAPTVQPRQRVLVVDDNTDSADMMSELLTFWGHDTQQAHDGLEAITVAMEFGPNIVLLDIGLPGIDGYEVARRLRAMPQTQTALIIAVSGYGLAVDRVRSTSAGFDLHLVKPVDIVALRRVVSNGGRPVAPLATVG